MSGASKEANYWPGFVDALSNVVVVMVFVLVVFTIALIHFSQKQAEQILAQVKEEQAEQAKVSAQAEADSGARENESSDAAAKPAANEQLEDMEQALKQAIERAAQAERRADQVATALEREQQARQRVDPASAQASQQASSQTGSRTDQTGAVGVDRQPTGSPSRAQAGSISDAKVEAEQVVQDAGETEANASMAGDRSALAILFPTGTYLLSEKTKTLLDTAFEKLSEGAFANGVELVADPETGPYSERRRLSYYRNLELRNWLIAKGLPRDKIRMRIAPKSWGKERGRLRLSVTP